jgi:hypothetical protein
LFFFEAEEDLFSEDLDDEEDDLDLDLLMTSADFFKIKISMTRSVLYEIKG